VPVHTKIKERRLALDLTQEELVARLHRYGLTGFTPSHISKIERGLRVVKGDEVPIFATALEVDTLALHDVQPEKRH
jgi:transcriptional regulator with XRE-family HTH domain